MCGSWVLRKTRGANVLPERLCSNSGHNLLHACHRNEALSPQHLFLELPTQGLLLTSRCYSGSTSHSGWAGSAVRNKSMHIGLQTDSRPVSACITGSSDPTNIRKLRLKCEALDQPHWGFVPIRRQSAAHCNLDVQALVPSSALGLH